MTGKVQLRYIFPDPFGFFGCDHVTLVINNHRVERLLADHRIQLGRVYSDDEYTARPIGRKRNFTNQTQVFLVILRFIACIGPVNTVQLIGLPVPVSLFYRIRHLQKLPVFENRRIRRIEANIIDFII
ncbi:hypothetical protein D3C78_1034740 [compost metagenome]